MESYTLGLLQKVPEKLIMYDDLAVHVGSLVSLLALFAGISGMLLWRMMVRIEKRLEELFRLSHGCRQELGDRFVSRFDHEIEHHGLWEALNYHSHDMRGRVIR